jgi:hypothetical protein
VLTVPVFVQPAGLALLVKPLELDEELLLELDMSLVLFESGSSRALAGAWPTLLSMLLSYWLSLLLRSNEDGVDEFLLLELAAALMPPC